MSFSYSTWSYFPRLGIIQVDSQTDVIVVKIDVIVVFSSLVEKYVRLKWKKKEKFNFIIAIIIEYAWIYVNMSK